MGFTLLTAAVEVTADGSKAAKQAADDIEGSPLADKAGSGFGKKLVAGIGLALAGAALGEKFSEALDIQVGQQKLAASLDLTKKQAATAGKVAGSLYSNNYGDSMEDVQDAVGAVIGTIDGMKDANESTVNAMTTKLLNLRSAFGIEVADSATSAAGLMKAGLVKNADEGVDLITAALQRVPPSMRQALMDASDEYAPYLAGLGFTGSQMFDVLVKSAKGGEIQIDKAGDAIKEFGIRATDGSKTTKEAFEDAGLFGDGGSIWKGLTKDLLGGGAPAQAAFQKIVTGLKGIKDPARQSSAALALFGTPLEDISVQDIPKFLTGLQTTQDGMGKTTGAADKMGKTLNANTKNSIESVQRGFSGFTNDLIANSGALGVVGTVAGTVGGPLLQMGGALALIVPALSSMGIVSKLAAVGQWLLNAAMSANPIGIVVLAIAALVAGLVWFFTQTELGRTVWANFCAFLAQAWANVVAVGKAVWQGLSTFLSGLWNGIVAFVTGYINTVVNNVKFAVLVLQVAWQVAWQLISNAVRVVWTAIVSFVTGYVNTVRSVIMAVVGAIVGWWTSTWNAIRTAAQTVWNAIVSVVTGQVNAVRNVVTNVINAVRTTWSTVLGAIRSVNASIWGGIQSTVSGIVNGIRSTITGAINTARSVWESGVNTIRSATSGAFQAAVGAVRTAVGTIGSIVNGIKGTIEGALAGASGWLVGAGRNIIQGLINGIQGMLGAVGNAIGGVVQFVKDHLPHSPAKTGPMSGSGWTQGVVGAGSAIVGGIADGFNREAARTMLAMPEVSTAGRYAGTMVAPGASLAAQRAGAPSGASGAAGDVFYVTLHVDMDQVSDVAKVVNVFKAIPQQARTGRQVVGA